MYVRGYLQGSENGRVVTIVWYDVVSSNPVHGKVFSIQNYLIKIVSDSRQVGGFSQGTPVSSINKADRHDITEIVLKVALNTINQTNLLSRLFELYI